MSSSWVLLSSKASDQTCTDQTTIFLKKKSGCPGNESYSNIVTIINNSERNNPTAEFGEDPEKIAEMTRHSEDLALKQSVIQTRASCMSYGNYSHLYILQGCFRAIDVHGRRITLDNERHNYIRKMGTGLFEFVFHQEHQQGGYSTTPNLVAFTCAIAGEK